MSLRSAVVFIVGALIGVAGHAAWSTAHPSSQAGQDRTARDTGAPAAAQPACTPDWDAMRSEVKQAVREVLQEEPKAEAHAGAAPAGTAGGGAVEAPKAPVETPDNKEAREAEAALLQTAIQAGRWTNQDVTKLRSLIPRLAPAERPKALAAISKAINDGQLQVDAVMPF
jgi:hypothetical protein